MKLSEKYYAHASQISLIEMSLAMWVIPSKVSSFTDVLWQGSPQCCAHKTECYLAKGGSIGWKVELERWSRAGVVVGWRQRNMLRWRGLGRELRKCRRQSGWTGLFLQVPGSHHQWHTHIVRPDHINTVCAGVSHNVNLLRRLSWFLPQPLLKSTFSLSLTIATSSGLEAPSLRLPGWRLSSTMPAALSSVNIKGPLHRLLVGN